MNNVDYESVLVKDVADLCYGLVGDITYHVQNLIQWRTTREYYLHSHGFSVFHVIKSRISRITGCITRYIYDEVGALARCVNLIIDNYLREAITASNNWEHVMVLDNYRFNLIHNMQSQIYGKLSEHLMLICSKHLNNCAKRISRYFGGTSYWARDLSSVFSGPHPFGQRRVAWITCFAVNV